MNEGSLAGRFGAVWQKCGGADPTPVWERLRAHYREAHRHYHTLGHIAQCLHELDMAGAVIEEQPATEMAIWFHDVIYVYGAKDNEIRSAAYFRAAAADSMPAAFVDRVCRFIIATQHTGAARDQATAYLVDIDLSGFGLPWEKYLADSDALRREAANVSDARYFHGKLCFLSELQQWPSLYQTEYFRSRLETTAQENIACYTVQLRAQGYRV